MERGAKPLHVSIVAVPDVMISIINGLYEALNSFRMLPAIDPSVPPDPPFAPEIVGETRGLLPTATGQPVQVERTIEELERTDIVIVPSLMIDGGEWRTGRYPELVRWLRAAHDGGALMCSACSGVLLLAETGLLQGHAATTHWAFAKTFRTNFPNVQLRLDDALVTAGHRAQFVMTGASTSWHDLALYLITRHVGSTAAQSIARFFAMHWHSDGQSPYVVFDPPRDHGDAIVLEAQRWLDRNFAVCRPLEEMAQRSGLAESSFKRRFTRATGYAPLTYVQRLRVEDAKRRLERTEASVDEISWRVGYEDPAFFRRLFRRVNGVSPRDYRRRYKVPNFAEPLAG